ncbi:MAG: nuclear transport factor 2 family protein [Caldilineaceae bacterium]
MHELIELEVQGWQALTEEGDAARDFYESVLREDAVMLFPGGIRLQGKDEILASFAAQPWQSFQFQEMQVISLLAEAGVVVYWVAAQRADTEPYEALISSTYVRDGDTWKLALHQQTPV